MAEPVNDKKDPKASVPKEVQTYYQAQKRERAGVAGILAVVTLVVTVLLALGLFFGSRWAYRRYIKKADTNTATSQTATAPTESSTNSSTSSGSNQDTEVNPAPNTSTSGTSPTPPSTPPSSSNGQSQSSIPNTGPGNVLAAFVIASVAGTAAHQVILRRRATS